MAVVGSAEIIVRAITTGVRRDIERGFSGTDVIGDRAGRRMGGSFKRGFLKESEQAFTRFKTLAATSFTIGPAISGAVSAISALVSGLTAFVAQAAAAAPAAAALGGSLSALVQGAGALKLAFSGVSQAIGAGLKPQSSSGAARDLTAELDALEQARRNLALTIERAGEAEERVVRAVNDAWEGYQDSIIETARAVNELKRAQKEAAEQTQQLGFDVEDAALAQERASIALEEARTRLQSVADLPPDNAARRDAELAFKEADLNYRRAADRNGDLKQQQEEAAAAGSAGADQLIAASNGVKDAKDNELKAYQAYEDAVVDAERSRRDSRREILRAEEAVLKAQEALNKAMNSGSQSANAFAQAMAKLSPEARKFVRYIISIQDEFKSLKDAAGRQLFGPLTEGIKTVVSNTFPMLRVQLEKTGGAIGTVLQRLGNTLSMRRNLGALSRIMSTNADVIVLFGRAGRRMVGILIQILDAARPLTRQFAQWVLRVAESWRAMVVANKKSGELARTFNYAKQTAVQLGQVFSNLVGGLFNIGKAAAGPGSGGELLLDTLEAATRKFNEFTAQINSDGSAAEYFRTTATNTIAISRALGSVVKGFVKLGDNKGVADFANKINESGGAIERLFNILEKTSAGNIGTVMGEVANNVAKILDAFTDTGSIEIFFGIIKEVTGWIADSLDNEVVQKIIAIIGAVGAATTALWLMSKPILFIGKVWVGALSRAATLVMGVGKAAMFAANPIAGVTGALQSLQVAARGTMFAPLAAALTSLGAGPLIAIVVGIAAVVAILVLAYQNSEKFRESISEGVDMLKGALLQAWGYISSALQAVADSFGKLTNSAEGASNIFKQIGDFIAPLVRIQFAQIAGVLKVVGSLIGFVVRIVGAAASQIFAFFIGIFDGIKDTLGFLTDASDGTGSFLDKLKGFWEGFYNVIATVINWLGKAVSVVSDKFINPLFRAIGWLFGWLIGTILKPFIGVVMWVVSLITSNWDAISSATEKVVNGLIGNINFLITAYNALADSWLGQQIGLETIDLIAAVDFSNTAGTLDDLNKAVDENADVAKRAAYTNDEFRKILESTERAALDVFDAFYAGRNVFVKNIKTNQELQDSMKSLDEKIEEGKSSTRELKIALFDLGQQYIDAARQAIENGESTGKAVKRIEEGRQAFLDGAVAMDISADKAQKLADKLGLTPEAIKKEFRVSGVEKLDRLNSQLDRLNTLAGDLQGVGGYALSTVNEQRQVLSAKIETQMNVVFGKGNSRGTPLYVNVVNTDGNGGIAYQAAKGGIFPARRGGHLVQVAEAGRPERIEPLDPNGLSNRDKALISYLSGGQGGGMTVNVYPSPGMDERELAEKVSRTIRSQMRKGAA